MNHSVDLELPDLWWLPDWLKDWPKAVALLGGALIVGTLIAGIVMRTTTEVVETEIEFRIVTTSDWTTFGLAEGDWSWYDAQLVSYSAGAIVQLEPDLVRLVHEDQAAAQVGMSVIEAIIRVKVRNVERRDFPTAFSRFFPARPNPRFQIERGHWGWTFVQVTNIDNIHMIAPAVVEHLWWSGIVSDPLEKNVKEFDLSWRALSNPQRPFAYDNVVDAQTLTGKAMFGYQGWFGCPADGSDRNEWIHWFRENSPTADNLTVDMWPDTRDYSKEHCITAMLLPNGEPATLFSSYRLPTVLTHFYWMRDRDLDGVFYQRFVSEIADLKQNFAFRTKVLQNVQLSAERTGRVFAVMYDIAGSQDVLNTITRDWEFLTNTLRITDSPAYLRHNGKPVVALWGLGFCHPEKPDDACREPEITIPDAQALIYWLRIGAEVTVMGGVPAYWRTQPAGRDALQGAGWQSVFWSFDILSPWTVGRFRNSSQMATFYDGVMTPDLQHTVPAGVEYMPVIWPGFSAHNLNPEKDPNEIPRRRGQFFRDQMNALLSMSNVSMIYIAMFDEVDEGTAMFKVAERMSDLPASNLVPLDVDTMWMPSDAYLGLARELTEELRN